MSQYLGDISAYALAVSQGYTGTEEEYAELMASYATVGQTAVNAAQTATTKASEAATSATTATNKATEATTAATTATTKAGEASTSASTATSAKDTAVSAASTATTKATEATTAAATAVSAKDDAVSANTAAQSAKTAAQTAQTGAETAAASVSASAAQIQTNASDISELKEDLNQKANIDGSYEDLVSGGAYQIISNMEEVDNTPYGYRTAGGSLEIGDREKLKKIVGGSLVVNQLIYGYEPSGCTAESSNGVVTITSSNSGNRYRANRQGGTGIVVTKDHVYLQKVIIKSDGEHEAGFQNYANPGVLDGVTKTSSASWTDLAIIKKATVSGVCYTQLMTSGGDTYQIKENSYIIFDLTAMFGTTIADYVYTLETATAGAGVAWLKAHFPKIFDAGYIPYNAGTLEHVSGLSAHKMVGFNQWDEQWEVGSINASDGSYGQQNNCIRSKNFCKILPNTAYYVGCSKTDGGSANKYYLGIAYYDIDKNFISATYNNRAVVTSPINAVYFKIFTNSSTVIYGNTYNHDICINLHWDGERDGEYEPYEEHSYPLDSDVTLRGIPKLDANNSLYYDGDEYTPDGTVTRRYGIVDLGTLNWVYVSSDAHIFQCSPPNMKRVIEPPYDNRKTGAICSMYSHSNDHRISEYMDDKSWLRTGIQFFIRDTSYDSGNTFKAAMSGVMLVYELAEPTTESADPYTEIQNVSNWGTEEFVTDALVPVGHETAYQPDLRAKIEVAPESPDGDGLYLMKRENGQNSYVAYIGELPSDPTTDGTYTLKCTVSGGTATKTWEADE